jgi:hypothetical protein
MQDENIKIIDKNSKYFILEWESALDKLPHSFIYTSYGINYYKSYCNFIDDLSFIIKKGDDVIGLAIILLEKIEDKISISANGGYLPSPLYLNDKAQKIIFNYIDSFIVKYNIELIKFYMDSSIYINNNFIPKYNLLKKYDFFETNNLNLYIDLTLDEKVLWANLNKSYKSLINKYTKNTKNIFFVMTKDNASWEIFLEFYNLHSSISKNKARNISLFKEQFKLLENGLATLFYIKNEYGFLSFSLFFQYARSVIYATSVSKKEKNEEPYSHFLLWNANLFFKHQNFNHIIYGSPSGVSKLGGIDDINDEKQLAISFFKRQMGAEIINVNRGIKFSSKESFKNFILEFAKKIDE